MIKTHDLQSHRISTLIYHLANRWNGQRTQLVLFYKSQKTLISRPK